MGLKLYVKVQQAADTSFVPGWELLLVEAVKGLEPKERWQASVELLEVSEVLHISIVASFVRQPWIQKPTSLR